LGLIEQVRFNRDYHVSFTKEDMAKGKLECNYSLQEFPQEEAPGVSVFYKDASGDIFTPIPHMRAG
jgi:predicted dithiol-disulfide oxidoreductase (DUF899 family)